MLSVLVDDEESTMEFIDHSEHEVSIHVNIFILLNNIEVGFKPEQWQNYYFTLVEIISILECKLREELL